MQNNLTIYHNPRCSKSRKALEILKEENIFHTIINYQVEGLNKKDLYSYILLSGLNPLNFIRTKEKEFIKFKNKDLSSSEAVAEVLSSHPKLLERPLIVYDKNVIIARPPELIKEIL